MSALNTTTVCCKCSNEVTGPFEHHFTQAGARCHGMTYSCPNCGTVSFNDVRHKANDAQAAAALKEHEEYCAALHAELLGVGDKHGRITFKAFDQAAERAAKKVARKAHKPIR